MERILCGLYVLLLSMMFTSDARAQDTAWCMNCDVISNAIRDSAASVAASNNAIAGEIRAQNQVNDTDGYVYFDAAKGVLGRSWNYPHAQWQEAQAAAQRQCRKAGGVDCKELLWARSKYDSSENQCGVALLVYKPGYGAPWGTQMYAGSLESVGDKLEAACFNLGKDKNPSQCKFLAAHCTYPRNAGGARPMQDSVALPKATRDFYLDQMGPHQWAAIQLSKERRKVGYGVGGTAAQAEAIAEKQCGVRGSNRRDCYSAGLYKNSCAAQSYGKLGAKGHFDHTSIKSTEDAAKTDALVVCQKSGAQECVVYYSNCVHD